ncbi:hypothetical protein LINGRAHAP2_LOCUS23130, partial [Linum grandiflorum]
MTHLLLCNSLKLPGAELSFHPSKWQTFRSVLQLQEYCCRTSNCWGVNKLVHVLDCQ